ncbi:hypothetical protein CHM34_18085 [Paludifilum halophilum]|uniref:ArpU family transcriptional regulator n=2 Tax=Paludifilum halophilum TaxID=1642702 RepID=A0A235B1K8_9BACL|nr:hypothetical protein CHM34_18085 [Paludifilum halophilum]
MKAVTYRKPTYRKEVERILKEYPVLKVAVETEQEAEKAGAGLYPSCTSSYEERVSGGYSEYQSSTERYGIRRASKQLKLRRIDQALLALDIDERLLVEERYFDQANPSDAIVYDCLGWSKRNYYRVKSRAFKKLAFALNLL